MPNGQYPVLTAGGDFTAAVVQAFSPFAAWKTGDTSIASSTALANDPDLVLNVTANAVYKFFCYLDYEGAATGTGDLKIQWNAPAGATMRFSAIGPSTSSVATPASLGTRSQGAAASFGTNGAGSLMALTMTGTLYMSGTSGTLQLQWAQNTSSATATIVHAQSMLELARKI